MKIFLNATLYVLILMGITGCMSQKQMIPSAGKSTPSEMLEYLEERYGEIFVEEAYSEGSTLFPEMYGGDKMLAHPAANDQIPFYVHKNVKTEGFSDNYPLSHISYRFTEQYRNEILNLDMDDREKAVKLSFGCGNDIDDPKYFNISVDEFAQDSSYDCRVHLDIAINGTPENNDRELFTKLYYFLNEHTVHDYTISVGYINSDRFEEAKEIIRMAHTINFNWSIIDDVIVLESKQVDSDDNIDDPTVFESK